MLLIKRVCHPENTRETKFSCPTYAQVFFCCCGFGFLGFCFFLVFLFCFVLGLPLLLKSQESTWNMKHIIFYNCSLGNSCKMLTQLARPSTGSPDWFTCAVSVSLQSWVETVRATPELGSFRVELTLQSFCMCHFTIPFQKAEFSKLAGTGELNSLYQGLWICWGHLGLS